MTLNLGVVIHEPLEIVGLPDAHKRCVALYSTGARRVYFLVEVINSKYHRIYAGTAGEPLVDFGVVQPKGGVRYEFHESEHSYSLDLPHDSGPSLVMSHGQRSRRVTLEKLLDTRTKPRR
ncbi:hypothetical protein HYY74_04240 [Candidatus Woesearchaeota archaeon]|nr:hypothetical protein [Candidatus Woesearchaeota archaeon]